jgi:ribosomal-protein-serine acetyltransferase
MKSLKNTEYEESGLLLRKYQLSDQEERLAAIKDSFEDLTYWFASFQNDSLEEFNELWLINNEINWSSGVEFCFMLKYTDSPLMLGEIRINNINVKHNFANLMYWIRSSEKGKGLAVRGSKIAIKIALEELKLNRLEIFMSTANEASRKVAEKAGAKFEGKMRKRISVQDRIDDAYLYSIIPEDLISERKLIL